jgi:zinc transporter 2
MSFGYHISEIIGALVSIVLIWSLTIWLLYETTLRFKVTPQVNGLIMIIIAIIGFCFNVIMGIILSKNGVQHNNSLHGQDQHNQGNENNQANEQITLHIEHQNEKENTNVNLRVSFMHVLGDALQNIGVLITGGIIFFFPNLSIADPVCAYFFSFIVVLITIRILKDCIFVLMEGSPVDIDVEQLEKDLKDIEGVKEILDLHVWRLSSGELSLSCHMYCNEPEKTIKKAQKMVGKKYKIDSINIQVKEKY